MRQNLKKQSEGKFKLDLSEAEKEVFSELFFDSDNYRVIYSVLEQLAGQKANDVLRSYQDGSEDAKARLQINMVQYDGMQMLIKNLKSLCDTLRKG